MTEQALARLREAVALFDLAQGMRDEDRLGDADEYEAQGERVVRNLLNDLGSSEDES